MSGPEKLPFSKQVAYAVGQFGWSTLMNLVNLTLVYFYIPPDTACLPFFVTQEQFFVVLNIITLILASGRLFDAVTDPLIAGFSDHSKHRKGRRIPFMFWSTVPAALFCALLFFPPTASESVTNIFWLVVIQFLFFLFITVYVTPYFALIAELGQTPKERLNLSTYISITYALGIVLAAQTPQIGNALSAGMELDKVTGLQFAVALVCVIAVIMMIVPTLFIDERRYCRPVESNVPIMESLKTCLKNPNFVPYVVADLAYFMGLTVIMTGMRYYIEVLLGIGVLPAEGATAGSDGCAQEAGAAEQLLGGVMTAIVVVSFLFYPVVNLLATRIGKKPLVLFAFLWFGGVFFLVYFLGQLPLAKELQIYVVAMLASIPMAFLGVLPNAILADIAEHDALKTGVRQEGMYFGARTLLQKVGVTGGVVVFAGLTNFGKDIGDDLGIRLSGMAGMALCVLAFMAFSRYREREVLAEIKQMEEKAE